MHGRELYQAQAASTAGPAQLVLMLYDGAIARVRIAVDAIAAEPADLHLAHDNLTRAQAIVHELSLTLDHERGGEIAGNLARLYTFCTEQLVEANLTKDAAAAEVAVDVLIGLRDAWEQACVAGEAVAS